LSHDRCLDIEGGNIASGTAVQFYDCNGTAAQKWVFSGNQIKVAANTGLCLAFDNPWFTTPRLRLASCSTSSRQQWYFEARNYTNPVGYGHDDFIGSMVY
ncbi:MAG TPA: ricin-type beta-trefoil lectin domain protein, partial [Micromonosporaceae bacterium]